MLIGCVAVFIAGIPVTVRADPPEVEGPSLYAGGRVDFGAIQDSEGGRNAGFEDMYVDFTLRPNEYNRVLLTLEGEKTGASTAAHVPVFELTTDAGSYFSLPVGFELTAGLTNLYTGKYEVTGHAYERTLVRSGVDSIPLKVYAESGGVGVTAGTGFGTDAANALSLVFGTERSAYEAFYVSGSEEGKAGFSFSAGELFGGIFGLAFGTAVRPESEGWSFGAGTRVRYLGLEGGLSLNGEKGSVPSKVGLELDRAWKDFGTAASLALFNENGDGLSFYGAGLSLYMVTAGARWRAGYIITENGYSYGSAVALEKGGAYFRAWLDF